MLLASYGEDSNSDAEEDSNSDAKEELRAEAEQGLNDQISLYVKEVVSGQVAKIDNVFMFDTIGAIKSKVEQQLGISSKEFRLVYAGKSLKQEYNCRDYNISDGSTLCLVVRIRGGGILFTSGVIICYSFAMFSFFVDIC